MELGFIFNEHTFISIQPIKVTFEAKMKVLVELNKNRMTPIYVTLVKKNVPESEYEDFKGGLLCE